ncbi:CorA family divalent cation transporter [Campylobacter sp.]|uniref:CorA family divalent cation transporter n=1 Tax=Campylobacter sp. TaxID=205 RepID=UPI003FA0432D
MNANLSGYFYGDGFDYIILNFGADSQKFLFKNGQIFKEELNSACDKNEFLETIKKMLDHFLNKILEHESELESYEKIYTGSVKVANFAKRHHILRYEIRKFESMISRIYEALQICAAEQNELKKELKNSIHKCGVLKNMISEYSARVEDIYTFIQSDKNDKINKNIYLLTLLSALFLPLNFITGFFGMNTQGLPFSGLKDATSAVVLLMSIVILFCIIFLFWYANKKR